MPLLFIIDVQAAYDKFVLLMMPISSLLFFPDEHLIKFSKY